MPTVTLRFRLPDEQAEFDRSRLGGVAINALWDIDQHCRSLLKHADPLPEVRQLCEHIRKLIPGELMDV